MTSYTITQLSFDQFIEYAYSVWQSRFPIDHVSPWIYSTTSATYNIRLYATLKLLFNKIFYERISWSADCLNYLLPIE